MPNDEYNILVDKIFEVQNRKNDFKKRLDIMTDKQTANAMKELFNPNVSIQSLRNSRRILQTADPDLFQDIKQQFLMDQLKVPHRELIFSL